MSELKGKHVLFLVGPDYEDLELWYPKLRVEEAGAKTSTVGPKADDLFHGRHGQPVTANEGLYDVEERLYDALVIPGGWMPRRMVREERLLELIRQFDAAGKPIAAASHGPVLLLAAGLVKGRTLTSTPGARDDLMYAGAKWVDEAAAVDGNLVTSRRPADLPDLTRELLKLLG